MNRLAQFTITAPYMVAVLGLSACGSSSDRINAEKAQELTGGSKPAETVTRGLQTPADWGRHTIFYGEGLLNGERVNFEFSSVCTANECTFINENPNLKFTHTYSDTIQPIIDDDETVDLDQFRAILTKNGITILEETWLSTNLEYSLRTYGAWMEYAAFGVTKYTIIDEPDEFSFYGRLGWAGGTRTGTRPSADATWKGLMVGTPREGTYRGNILQGDALLVYDLSNTNLDVTFSDIKDLTREKDYETPRVFFEDVPVEEDGRYGADGISGDFAGPNHEETAGVFDKDGIVGAYGARITE